MGDSRSLKLRYALPLAAIGGLALDVATPWLEWWFAGGVGAVFVIAALWQQTALRGLILGAVAGSFFWLPHIYWLTLYLGPIPWLALSTVMILWFAVFGIAAALATRGLRLLPLSPLPLALLQAVGVGGLWVLREQLQSTWPYGGFAWGRLAHTVADSPLSATVSWVGFAGVSGLLAVGAGLIVAAAFSARAHLRDASILAGVAVLLLFTMAFLPPALLDSPRTLKVAAVQGNSKSGIFDDRENGDVIRDHIEVTERLLDELEQTGEHVDVIVWPENSGEFQLPEQYDRAHTVQQLAARANAPIIVGTILQNEDGSYTNSSLVFDAQGDTGQRYDKRRPVPFAEYMPNRQFFRALVPDLVDLVQLDYSFGQRSAVLPIATANGEVSAGIAICFDIIFDDHAVVMNSDGAQIIFAQTNNADFGRTDESAQQLQIARLRAIEMGRTLVNISTVGTSAVVLPSGKDAASLTPFTADAMVVEVPLYEGHTPAVRFGGWISAAWVTVGLGAVILGSSVTYRRKVNEREE